MMRKGAEHWQNIIQYVKALPWVEDSSCLEHLSVLAKGMDGYVKEQVAWAQQHRRFRAKTFEQWTEEKKWWSEEVSGIMHYEQEHLKKALGFDRLGLPISVVTGEHYVQTEYPFAVSFVCEARITASSEAQKGISVASERWSMNGQTHREIYPAIYEENSLHWLQEGKNVVGDGCSMIQFWKRNGIIEDWNILFHLDPLGATECRIRKMGKMHELCFMGQNVRFENNTGPARVIWEVNDRVKDDVDERVLKRMWYVEGTEVRALEHPWYKSQWEQCHLQVQLPVKMDGGREVSNTVVSDAGVMKKSKKAL